MLNCFYLIPNISLETHQKNIKKLFNNFQNNKIHSNNNSLNYNKNLSHNNEYISDTNAFINNSNNINSNIINNTSVNENEKGNNNFNSNNIEKEEYKILLENKDYEKNMEKREEQNENNSMNCGNIREEMINENSLKNWFSCELVSKKRSKIKQLILELSNIEKEVNKNDLETTIKIQNNIIKKYMDDQKNEFNNYFVKIEKF